MQYDNITNASFLYKPDQLIHFRPSLTFPAQSHLAWYLAHTIWGVWCMTYFQDYSLSSLPPSWRHPSRRAPLLQLTHQHKSKNLASHLDWKLMLVFHPELELITLRWKLSSLKSIIETVWVEPILPPLWTMISQRMNAWNSVHPTFRSIRILHPHSPNSHLKTKERTRSVWSMHTPVSRTLIDYGLSTSCSPYCMQKI